LITIAILGNTIAIFGNIIAISGITKAIFGNIIAITEFQGMVDKANYQFPFIFRKEESRKEFLKSLWV
jgi:hypothetical protein